MKRSRLAATLAVTAALWATPVVFAQTSTPSTTAAGGTFESERAEAVERLRVAQELFARQNFDAALAEFERLYELLAGRPARPRVLFNIAQCQEQLGRYDQAVSTYQRYLQEMGDRAENRDAVGATLRTLESLLGTLQIESNVVGAEVYVDDRRVGVAPGAVRVAGGRHVVQLRSAGHVPSQQEVQIAGRATRSLRFSLERIPVSRGLRPVYFWSAVGVTAAVLAAGVVIGGVALGQDASARSLLEDPARRFTVTESSRDDIRALALTADVLYGTAAAIAISAGVLYALTDFRGRGAERARSSVAVLPWREGASVGLSLGGAF